MRYLLHRARMQHLIKSRNGYLALAAISLLVNLLFTILLFFNTGRERIVIVPPEIKRGFWVTGSKVSPEYLSEMTLFLTSLSFNVSPANIDMQHSLFLRYVDSSYYDALKVKLIDIKDKVKKEHVTTSIFPNNIRVDDKNLTAIVSGDLVYNIGDVKLAPERVTYQFGFKYNQGLLRLTSLSEIKAHA